MIVGFVWFVRVYLLWWIVCICCLFCFVLYGCLFICLFGTDICVTLIWVVADIVALICCDVDCLVIIRMLVIYLCLFYGFMEFALVVMCV